VFFRFSLEDSFGNFVLLKYTHHNHIHTSSVSKYVPFWGGLDKHKVSDYVHIAYILEYINRDNKSRLVMVDRRRKKVQVLKLVSR
jgi:hypothetical protein